MSRLWLLLGCISDAADSGYWYSYPLRFIGGLLMVAVSFALVFAVICVGWLILWINGAMAAPFMR